VNILLFWRKNYKTTHYICILSGKISYSCIITKTILLPHLHMHSWMHTLGTYIYNFSLNHISHIRYCTAFKLKVKENLCMATMLLFYILSDITLIKAVHTSKLSLHIIARSYGTSLCFCHVITIIIINNDWRKQKVWQCGVLRWYNLHTNRSIYSQSTVIF
jgi:hypothetical protein